MYTCLSGELMFISCREQTWGRGDQTVGYGAERGSVCCKQQQIKKKQPSAQRFALARGISPLTNRTSDVHFSMTSARPSLLSSPLLSSQTLPLVVMQKKQKKRSPCVLLPSAGVGVPTQGPCVDLCPLRASERAVGHRL